MKTFIRIVALIALLAFPSIADAATCFWVGGTGTYDLTNTGGGGAGGIKWATASGGSTPCAATGGVPKNVGDVATFDLNSGSGTVTGDSSINGVQINTINFATAISLTLDFSVNNPSMTLGANGAIGFNLNGTGASRTLKLGSGTFTLVSASSNGWDATTTTGLTFVGGSATFNFGPGATANGQSFIPGSLNYSGNAVVVQSRTNGSYVSFSASTTFLSMILAAPCQIAAASGATITINNAVSWAGSSGNAISLFDSTSTSGGVATWALAAGSTIQWAAIRQTTFTGSPTITNSFDLGQNTGATINPPSGGSGGGGHIIGG